MGILCVLLIVVIFFLISSSSKDNEKQKDKMLDLKLENDSLRVNPFYQREKILGFTRQDIIMLHDCCFIYGLTAKELVEKIEKERKNERRTKKTNR